MSTVRGLNKVIADLRALSANAEQMVKDEVEGAGREIERQAKQLAPSNPPELKQFINYRPENDGLTAVISQNLLPLGAYIEFGTGAYVAVNPEWKDLAWSFYKNGMGTLRPHPYLYPAYVQGRKRLLEQLKKGLERLTR